MTDPSKTATRAVVPFEKHRSIQAAKKRLGRQIDGIRIDVREGSYFGSGFEDRSDGIIVETFVVLPRSFRHVDNEQILRHVSREIANTEGLSSLRRFSIKIEPTALHPGWAHFRAYVNLDQLGEI